MAIHQHLPLQRVEGQLDRRKRSGFGQSSGRDPKSHGAKIQSEVSEILEAHKTSPKVADIDPALILKVETTSTIAEEDWARIGLTILANEPGQTLILFADDGELTAFQERIAAYNGEKPESQKGQPYAGLIEAIEAIRPISPADRIGPVLKSEGYLTPESLPDGIESYDVELWLASDFNADIFVHRATVALEQQNGSVISTYRGSSALLMRVRGGVASIRALLELPEVSTVDRLPAPDWPELAAEELTLDAVTEAAAAESDAIVIGVVDSGINSGHPLLVGSLVTAFGEPDRLGDSDEKGHGTPVSGIAIYGDVRQGLAEPPLQARFRVASARVVNAEGQFDDQQLIAAQMEKSIRRLCGEFGCRVINVSLGDIRRPVGARPSAWAAVLDSLARELDIVIVVSAGNASGNYLTSLGDGIVAQYPGFLLDDRNRIIEPSSAINVLTVGSITHSNGLSITDADNVGVRSVAQMYQPSPFTRVGPEPPRVCRRQFGLSYAAMAGRSSMA